MYSNSIGKWSQVDWCRLIISLYLVYHISIDKAKSEVDPTNSKSSPKTLHTRSFEVDRNRKIFLKDGEPFQYISGSMHYFRIPRDYWSDRLNKAKQAGLDAIEIYVPWNYHEPEEGVYNFEGNADVEQFLELAAKYDLLVIFRAGPYICAEWDFGGLPAWLLRKNPNMKIRSSAPDYMVEVTRWMDKLLPRIRRFLYSNGGPIIMVQMENEYGSYKTCDAAYLSELYDTARRHLGTEIVLFTTDGASVSDLRCGSSDTRYLATIDFGPTEASPDQSFGCLESFRPNQPWVNSEFYVGWFDPWGGKHAHTDAKWSTDSLMRLMKFSPRINVNLYMFHGGTNFGYTAGTPEYIPVITSYDYDAPVSEAGDVTPKYAILQEAIFAFRNKSRPPLPSNISRMAYGKIPMNRVGHILFEKDGGISGENPTYMESFHQYNGFALYSTALPSMISGEVWLKFAEVADIAYIYTTDKERKQMKYHDTVHRGAKSVKIQLDDAMPKQMLLILVENRGHRNYGYVMDATLKGLIGPVTANGRLLTRWQMLGFSQITNHTMKLVDSSLAEWPLVGSTYTGKLQIDSLEEKQDTYIHLDTFKRGYLIVNDFNLGRYDMPNGPQLRLYLPAPVLKVGENILTIVELDGIAPATNDGQLFVTSHKDQVWSK
ncbi:Beta-galactosidase [Fasciola gigantica]|uniref:Beta-galactosidase n=1 Tax=Fasciola gigantica TaxID=46835 RepID=A0A504YNM0_FASGI|nr:Beta-galactosidase [Fasciola gigantica]